MSIVTTNKANYAIAIPMTGNHEFHRIWTGNTNAISFQVQWTAGLASGDFVIYASNQDLSNVGSGSAVTYPPPLTPIELFRIGVSVAPYVTRLAAGFDLVTAFNFVWISYEGVGGGNVSISTNVKSYG